MSVQDDLATVSSDLDTLKTAVEQAVTDLNSTEPSAADSVLQAVISALEAANYTVTPPAPADAPEITASDSSS